ncbi:hemin uptake protein HemP [Luteimonas sp. e5]
MFDLPLDSVAPDATSAAAVPAASAHPQVAAAAQCISISSAALLQGAREVLIRHGDACYRLRHTRNDKLILTK